MNGMNRKGSRILVLGAVLAMAGLAQADPMPTLSPYPPELTLSQTNYATYSDIILSGESYFPYGVAVGDPPTEFGDDCTLITTLNWQEETNDTELGLLVRGDLVNLNCYEVSMNPTNNYLALVKIVGGTSWTNLDLDGPIDGFNRMDEHKLIFTVKGTQLEGWLYTGSTLIGHVSATDSTYTTGEIGVFELKKGESSIHGEFDYTMVTEAAVMEVTPIGRQFLDPLPRTTTFEVANGGEGDMVWSAQVLPGADWLTITAGSAGTNGGTISATMTMNTSGADRLGTVRVTAEGALGQPKDVTVFQRWLLPADHDSDGDVDLSDFSPISVNFMKTGMTWFTGDYTGDGQVTISDFSTLSVNFLKTTAIYDPTPTPIPSPPAGETVTADDTADPLAEVTTAAKEGGETALPCTIMATVLMSGVGLSLFWLRASRRS